jgi:hypothetical protein
MHWRLFIHPQAYKRENNRTIKAQRHDLKKDV